MTMGRALRTAMLAALAALAAAAAPVLGAEPLARSSERREEVAKRDLAGADLLKDLEWAPGSRDPSVAEEGKAWVFEPYDRNVRQPTHVFGVHYPERLTKEEKKKGGLPGGLGEQFETAEDLDAAKLGAALVSAYTASKDPARLGTGPLLREYERMLKTNEGFARRLRDHFARLDLNHDRAVDVHEINHAVNAGELSYIGARVLKSWDINFSRRLSWEEFRLGPIFVVVLESHPRILQGFRLNVPGIETTVARLYRAALGTYYMTNPAATGLLEVETSAPPAPPALEKAAAGPADAASIPVRTPPHVVSEAAAAAATTAAAAAPQPLPSTNNMRFAEAQAGAKAGAQAGAGAEALSEAAVQARVLEHLGLTAQAGTAMSESEKAALRRDGGFFDTIKKGLNAFTSNNPGMKPVDRKANEDDKRPKAVWGIPKTVDQECVICQYVVQRVQAELKTAVVDDFTSFGGQGSGPYPQSAFPSGGFPGADSVQGLRTGFPSVEGMPDSRRDSVGPRARLVSERGSRSPTRLIEGVITKVMRKVCGETAPYLFRDMCADVFKVRSQLAYGIFRRLSSGGACMMAEMCGTKTYFYTKIGVHYAAMSSKFNAGTGLCGMIGGPKAREYSGASDSSCFTQKLGKKIGILRFQQEGLGRQEAGTEDEEQSANPADKSPEELALERRTQELNERDPMRLGVLTEAVEGGRRGGPPVARARPAADEGMQLNDA